MQNKLSRKTLRNTKKPRRTWRGAAPLAIPAALGIGAALGALATSYGRAPLFAFGARARGWWKERTRPAGESPDGAGRPIANPIASGL